MVPLNPALLAYFSFCSVRYRKEDGSYVLSLTFEREPRHYKIEQHLNKLSIEGGQYFETLIEMIDHYHFRQDGLLCKLRHIVEAPDFARSRSGCSSVSSEFLESHLKSQSPAKKKDRTVSIGGVMASVGGVVGGAAARTASHSLPSLSSLVTSTAVGRVTSTTTTTNSTTNSDPPRKTSSPETPSRDLISFNDWPNVSLLLANQQSNNGMKSNGQSVKNAPNKLPKPLLPMLHPVQLSTEIGEHTPFTPITPCAGGLDGSPTPKPASTGSPTSPFSRVRLKTSPTKPSPPPLPTNKQFSVEELRRRLQSWSVLSSKQNTIPNNYLVDRAKAGPPTRAFSSSATFPSLPAAVTTTATTTITNTFGVSGSTVKPSAVGSRLLPFPPNNSLPPESLHCPPIIDAPWEELDGSEDRSLPGSSGGSAGNPDVLPPPPPPLSTNPFLKTNPASSSSSHATAPSHHVADKTQTTASSTALLNNARSVLSPIEEAQKIYDSLPESTFFLNPEHLSLMERLGGGNFGQVVKGIYRTPHGQEVPVAVKTLKESQIASTGEQSILSEAKMMTQLKHRHIVRLIGVCKAQRFMLVLELAPLGPINKFLKKHPDTSVSVITDLMYQVAQGMAYLESCKFVHRDLAARNVLLVTQRFAKISDFGMSKALNFGNDYYRAASAGKWPLKWYAPECIYYFRFDSKSDVWSYGITLWEVFSFGERPYKDMKGAQILSMLDQGLRLSRPPRCPDAVYAVMQECWNFEGVRRPTFAELVLTMSRLSKALSSVTTTKDGATAFPAPPPPSGFEPVSSKSSAGVIPSTTGSSGGSGVNSGTSDMAFF
ncbi:hypothetical protein SprV_0100438700 [Sparganum proliferum]